MALLFWLLTLSCIVVAIVLGGRDGRIATSMIVLAILATMPIHKVMTTWSEFSFLVLVSDGALFAGFFWLALKSDRSWPTWMAGMQLNAVLVSLAANFVPVLTDRIYAGLESIWSLPILVLMAIGVLLDHTHQIRQRS